MDPDRLESPNLIQELWRWAGSCEHSMDTTPGRLHTGMSISYLHMNAASGRPALAAQYIVGTIGSSTFPSLEVQAPCPKSRARRPSQDVPS
ncbi:hypothetical protein J6590_003762 [Homalodisca vitripennis]|nr:hypothetical protein J6590_003762 [Homalodisca vitripennis]